MSEDVDRGPTLKVGDEIILRRKGVINVMPKTVQGAVTRAEPGGQIHYRVTKSTKTTGWELGSTHFFHPRLHKQFTWEVVVTVHDVTLTYEQFEFVRDVMVANLDLQDEKDRKTILAIDPAYLLPPIYDCYLDRDDPTHIKLGDQLSVRRGRVQSLNNARILAWGYFRDDDDEVVLSVLALTNEHSRRVYKGETADAGGNTNAPANYVTFHWWMTDGGVTEVTLFTNINSAQEHWVNVMGMDN